MIFILAFLLFAVTFDLANGAVIDNIQAVNTQCRDLFSCTIRSNCVELEPLQKAFDNATLNASLYNVLDKHIDYGCIFTSGCLEECNRCSLCETGKQQLVDVLSGSRRQEDGECSVLVNCAADCVEKANSDFTQINYCLRHKCAFHCFDGTCPKCSAFVTRIFNQICVSGELRKRIPNFNGFCYEMFRSIVYAKFEAEFVRTGKMISIGNRQVG